MCQEYAEKQFFGYRWHQIHGQFQECQFLCHDECGVEQDQRGVFLTCYCVNKSSGVKGH